MIDYKKPLKAKANEDYLRTLGIKKEVSPYKEEVIEQKKLFLIICEGENTEPGYFEGFPVPTKTVLIEGGCGSKTALVDYALELRKEEKYQNREVWCVFDFDIKPDESASQPEDFNKSIEKANQNGLNVAWSNDAFELWFVLHYQKLDTALTRKELYPILKEKWGLESFSKEAKTIKFCEDHYERFGGSKSKQQELAIRRAKELHAKFIERKDYSKHCPCTTVYLLVEELNKNLKG
jgi:hypothetical protein